MKLKIERWGDDPAIRLPDDLAEGWREGDLAEVATLSVAMCSASHAVIVIFPSSLSSAPTHVDLTTPSTVSTVNVSLTMMQLCWPLREL